jgi:3-oxoacyl-[acyl-carrier-protein] synthase-3
MPEAPAARETTTPHPFTTIEDVAVFLPPRTISVEQGARDFGLSRPRVRMLRRIHGFAELRADPELGLFDLLTAAARQALRSVADPLTIRYVLFAHTVLAITPSYLSTPDVIRRRLGLDRAEPFAITQQHCADGLSALDIAGELLRAGGDPAARALLVTGEKRLTSLVRFLGSSTAIGEASAACLIGVGGAGDRVLSYADRTVGLPDPGNWVSEEAANAFNGRYTEDLAGVIEAAVLRAGLCLGDIAMVIPHNVSRLLWRRTVSALGLDPARVYLDTVPQYGHCYCSDPFLNLESLRRQGRLEAGGRYLLTSVGLGATHSAAVIEHCPARRGGPDD